MRIPEACLSVRLSVPREKKSPWLRQCQSYISNWYINGKAFTSTTIWKAQNSFFSKKFEFWFLTKSWNHLSFVNISPTLVIDASMERSSRVLHHGNPKMWIFLQKVRNRRNWILSVPRVSVCREKKSPWLCQYQSYISNWYVNGKVFTSTITWEPKIRFFFKKVRNWIWLVLKSWNHHSSRSHLYVDIGDASSSLWGSTSSFL